MSFIFPLAFKIFFITVFKSLSMRCLGLILINFARLWAQLASQVYIIIYFTKFGTFSHYIKPLFLIRKIHNPFKFLPLYLKPGSTFISFLFYLFIYCILGLHPWDMEVPGLGVELELQLLATATVDPSKVCDLYHSS